jgi:hypothetical protein
MGPRPVLRKPAISFILSPYSNELSQQTWINTRTNCLFKELLSHISFSRLCAPKTNLWRIHCVWVCRTPYLTILAVSVPTQVEPCFVRKKQIVQNMNPFLCQNNVADYRITARLVANKTDEGSELMLNHSANLGSVHCSLEGGDKSAPYVLMSLSMHVWYLGVSYTLPPLLDNNCKLTMEPPSEVRHKLCRTVISE